jgi:hypothetical protein
MLAVDSPSGLQGSLRLPADREWTDVLLDGQPVDGDAITVANGTHVVTAKVSTSA